MAWITQGNKVADMVRSTLCSWDKMMSRKFGNFESLVASLTPLMVAHDYHSTHDAPFVAVKVTGIFTWLIHPSMPFSDL